MTAAPVRTADGTGGRVVPPAGPPDPPVPRALPRQRTVDGVRQVRRAARRVPGLVRLWRWLRLDLAGVVGAFALLGASLTPSLLPRTWAYQAAVSGVAAAFGYAVGTASGLGVRVLGRALARWAGPLRGTRLRVGGRARALAWATVGVTGAAVTAWFLVRSAVWQTELRLLMGAQSPGPDHYLLVLGCAGALFLALLGSWRWLHGLARRMEVRLRRWVPVPVAVATSVTSVGVLTVWTLNGLLLPALLAASGAGFGVWDRVQYADLPAPTSTLRSGGPGSLVPWETVNRKGREFLASGPTRADLTLTSGAAAREPVRVYVGLAGAPTMQDRAALAVRELERTGGFERSVLLVATATGTGWVDAYAAAALEQVHGGDTAIVSMQYSRLPSWLTILSDASEADRAGTVLLDAVRARWEQVPPDRRPRLLVYGESLGAAGSAAPFADLDDVLARTDGALWVGQPTRTRLVSDLIRRRDEGSTVVAPVHAGGAVVRFWTGGDAPVPLEGSWEQPRVLVLSHASDPVSRWSPRLLVEEPEWMREPPADDVLPGLTWYPFVTFWQVSADMALSMRVPTGHGHRYGVEHVDAWYAVAPPAAGPVTPTPQRLAELRAAVRSTV